MTVTALNDTVIFQSTLGDDDTSLDMTIGSEMTLDSANQPWNNPFVQWPKVRLVVMLAT